MSTAKKKSTKKKASRPRVKLHPPDLDEFCNDLMDVYAQIAVGFRVMDQDGDDEHGSARSVVSHGVIALEKFIDRLEEASLQLYHFLKKHKLEMEYACEE